MRMIVIRGDSVAAMFAVATRNLHVRRGESLALANLTIDIPLGAAVAVVGANGSGKSTLLGALTGLYKPSRGSAETIEDPALVLQATEVDDGMPITVLDAVRLARYPSVGLLRRFKAIDHEIVRRSVERMGIAPLLDRRMQDLSGGQRQRVLMAQGLAQDSQVLLLDEPMTGLDVTSRELVLDVIADEVAQNRAVLMATHSLADARACDLVLLLKTSAIAFGTPDDVLDESNLVRTFGHKVVRVGDELTVDDHHEH